jgi:starch synthase
VANDWHAGLVPCYIAGKYRRNGVYKDARCITAIHNMSHQGVEPSAYYGNLGLPSDWWDPLSWAFPDWAANRGPAINVLKGAIVAADRVVTVSQGYAWEITTNEGGWGLHGILQERQGKLNGITNGIDMNEWDPEHDVHAPAAYSVQDLSGKAACKAALQKELGFEVSPKTPLLGYIARLDFQKGPDVVLQAVPEMAQRGCQVVMLGSGVPEYEQQMRQMEQNHREHFRGWVGFSVPVAHRIIAGCDILLMPSRFEPCGLNQLYAMKYGAVPVAHATGGLKDTVLDFHPETQTGTGWTYDYCDAAGLMHATGLALHTLRNHPQDFEGLQKRGMERDSSWNGAAEQYEQIFEWALLDAPYA